MPRHPNFVPVYRRHKARNQVVCTVRLANDRTKDIYPLQQDSPRLNSLRLSFEIFRKRLSAGNGAKRYLRTSDSSSHTISERGCRRSHRLLAQSMNGAVPTAANVAFLSDLLQSPIMQPMILVPFVHDKASAKLCLR